LKLIAVSQCVDVIGVRAERRDALDQLLSAWLMSAGYVPVPVPNQLSQGNQSGQKFIGNLLLNWLDMVQPSGVVLSGGNDLGECPERDETENILLQWAEKNLIPVLGICRGMQMLGVRTGGRLKPVVGHVRTRHTLVSDIFSGEANSYHNFALAECPLGYKVAAQSEDGEIEAIMHISLPWEGWMWHPEREVDFQARDIHRVRELFGE